MFSNYFNELVLLPSFRNNLPGKKNTPTVFQAITRSSNSRKNLGKLIVGIHIGGKKKCPQVSKRTVEAKKTKQNNFLRIAVTSRFDYQGLHY